MSDHSRDAGSIVIEAMVAALIVAAVAGTLFETMAAHARADRLVAARRNALLVAQSQLAAAGVVSPLGEGTREGRAGDLIWRVSSEPYEDGDESDVDPVRRVTVTVRAANTRAPLATLSTLRIDE
jgi:membrane protein implicated in regulation of membrane protease activity